MIAKKNNLIGKPYTSLLLLFLAVSLVSACNRTEKNVQEEVTADGNESPVKETNAKEVDTDHTSALVNQPGKQTVPPVGSKEVIYMDGDLTKAVVLIKDSTISVNSNIRLDHRIFGYAAADTNSKKMILFSVFTDDVEGNPYRCPFGAYYDTYGMEGQSLKFVKKEGAFIKANILKENEIATTIYFDKNWVEFTDY